MSDFQIWNSQIDPRPYVLAFYSDHCSACPAMKIEWGKLQKKGYVVHMVNTSQNQQLARQYNIRAIPTSVIVHADSELKRFIGFQSHAVLAMEIDKFHVPQNGLF